MRKRDRNLTFWFTASAVFLVLAVVTSAVLIFKYKNINSGEAHTIPVEQNRNTVTAAEVKVNNNESISVSKVGKIKKPKPAKTKERYTPIKFLDAFKVEHEAMTDNSLKMHPYDVSKFVRKGSFMSYEDENYTSRVGIDVSHHQHIDDWKKVKEEGIDFAFIRIGARGYAEKGGLINDREFEYNIENAKKAGIDLGIYFYSQAVNVKEAEEEADFVLKSLKGRKLDLPVIYDPEHVFAEDEVTKIGRNSKVTKEQFTENTLAFFKKIEKAGYKGGIYANMLWQTGEYDLSRLQDYPMWFADYEPKPQSPYAFEYWQYYNRGKLKSIKGYYIDMNIQLIKK